MNELLARARYDADGLVAAIAQDAVTRRVLMLGYMNADTLRQTLETRLMTYWSRSRQRVWVKGETSGHVQHVKSVEIDCDGDALLFQVEQVGGAACHTGHESCFYRALDGDALVETEAVVVEPETLYASAPRVEGKR